MFQPRYFLVLIIMLSVGAVRGQEKIDPVADPAAMVVSGNARFTILTPRLVRLEWSPDGKFEDRASQVFINRRLPVPKFTQADRQGFLTVATDKIEIRYRPGARFDKAGLTVLARTGPNDTTWELAPPFENTANLGGTTRTLDEVSGSCKLEPGLLSQAGWTFIDDSQRLLFDTSAAPSSATQASSLASQVSSWPWAVPRQKKDAIDWYFFVYGHDYKVALADFIKVAGRIPLPPRFVFGAWWSRYWDYSADELKQLVKEFREHDVPLDVLVIDMGWHLDGWTGYTWNPKYFPEPEGFLKWVHEQGLKATLNLHPAEGVGKQEKQFPEMCRAMGLDPAKTQRIPFDCTDRRYVEAYFDVLHHPLERRGIDFWWIDWQQGKNTKIDGLDPLWWLNYLHWTDMEMWHRPPAGEKQEESHRLEASAQRRPILFSRWGGLGNHRYQIGFSGDTISNWRSLAFQPYFTATAGNVGYAYWSHDIGGHMPGKVDPELYVRWIQWGALSPILRTHTTKNPEAERRIWAYPAEYFEAAKKAYQLRYELIPYIYTAARQCYDTGVPICRPLYYEWPEESEAYKRDGEYMFGDQMLAAPVTEPADPVSGCAMVEVWLPPGKWTNWYTGRTYEGPKTIPLVVPLDEIPLFVKGGGIIVTQPKMARSDEKPADPLIVHIFPGDAGEARFYEDDGRSASYARGELAWTSVSHTPDVDKHAIAIVPAVEALPKAPGARRYEIFLHGAARPSGVSIAGKMLAVQATNPTGTGWSYDSEHGKTVIRSGPIAASEKLDIQVICQSPSKDNEFGYNQPTSWDSLLHRVAEVNSAVSASDVRNRSVVRLLGLFNKLVFTRADADGRAFTAECRLATTLNIPIAQKLDGRMRFISDGRFMPPGEGQREFHGLATDTSIALTMNFEDAHGPQTTRVRAEIQITNDELSLTIPLEKIVFPSINGWWIAGPFDAKGDEALAKPFPPEKGIDLSAVYDGPAGRKIGWKRFNREIKPGDDVTAEFYVDFESVFGRRVNDCVVYGFTWLLSPDNLDAVLALGSDDGCAVWLNGREVHRIDGGRSYESKSDRVPVKIRKGPNALLIKVAQGDGGGGFCVHLEDAAGHPLTQIKTTLDEPRPGERE